MKRIIFVLIFIGALMPLIAQEGVKFENLTLKEALNKAEKIDKQVFVDCYTSWCGPCKNMTENIFPQKVVGDYFNVNFVCVKYDMEKGEGPEIAKQYEIRAYPTFLILNPDGTLVHKIVGGRDAKGIIRSAMEAMDENKATGKMDEKYKAGERFGLIRFGSRLDVYLPEGVEPQVCLGQTMVAGETVIADLSGNAPQMKGIIR